MWRRPISSTHTLSLLSSKRFGPGPPKPRCTCQVIAANSSVRVSASAPVAAVRARRDAAIATRLEEELAFFVGAQLPTFAFPDYETLPYDRFAPHPDIISQRLRTLARLPTLTRGIVISDLPTALQRTVPRSFVDAHALALRVGQELDLEDLRVRLAAAGYASVPQVGIPGEFAIRGSLFDIFPMGREAPLRLDLFDRQIDSIRSFDPETQRSTDRFEKVELLPAREFSLSAESIKEFRRRFRTRFEGDRVPASLVRLAVGLEDVDDLWADLEQELAAAGSRV